MLKSVKTTNYFSEWPTCAVDVILGRPSGSARTPPEVIMFSKSYACLGTAAHRRHRRHGLSGTKNETGVLTPQRDTQVPSGSRKAVLGVSGVSVPADSIGISPADTGDTFPNRMQGRSANAAGPPPTTLPSPSRKPRVAAVSACSTSGC